MIATDTDYATLRIRMPQGASLRSNSKSHGETSKALRNMRRVRQARDLPAHLTAQPRRPRFRSGHQRRRLARPSVIPQVAQERQILDLTLVRLWRRSGIEPAASAIPLVFSKLRSRASTIVDHQSLSSCASPSPLVAYERFTPDHARQSQQRSPLRY